MTASITAVGLGRRLDVQATGTLHVRELTRAAGQLPHAVIEQPRFAALAGHEDRADLPLDVGDVARGRDDLKVTPGIAANARNNIMHAVFRNRAAGEGAVTLCHTLALDQ